MFCWGDKEVGLRNFFLKIWVRELLFELAKHVCLGVCCLSMMWFQLMKVGKVKFLEAKAFKLR